MRKGQRVELSPTGYDEDGLAEGEVSGVSLRVPGGVPGDRLAVVVEHQSPHAPRAWGRIERILSPSPDRVPPACPNVGRCGGCLMQCAAYPVQLGAKQQRIERAVGRAVLPIVPSPDVLHYRNKAKLVVGPGIVLGSYAPRSHEVIDMAGCQVTETPLDPVARTVAKLLTEAGLAAYDERTGSGDLRHVILRSNHAGQVLAVLVSPRRGHLGELARALRAAHPEVAGVVENINPARGAVLWGTEDHVLEGAGELIDRVGEVELHLSARAFFQINRAQAAALYAAVRRAAEDAHTVADVYSGVGGIALTLARTARRVIAIEDNPVATADARRSAEAAGARHLEIISADAAAGLQRLDAADVVILNPPRKGCAAEVLAQATRLQPRRMIYVSCGPESLARDLAILAQLGYTATTIEPFDLFPHTPHVESVTVLDRAAA